jgi:pyruvate/2-oxoglutarate dehydrogenase complex dihydrolipoamide acyltransferase (E2) component
MQIVDRFTRDRVSRFVWGGLTLACLAGFFLAREAQDQALDDQVGAAIARTEAYAADVFSEGLVADRSSPVPGMSARELYTLVRGEIFTDPTAARVRVYDVEGTLVYDTGVRTLAELVQADDPNVAQALDAGTHEVIVREPFSWSTISPNEGEVTSLLHVYTPLLLSEQVAPEGVVDVAYLMDELQALAKGPWPTVQLVLGLLLLLCLAMTVLSLRGPAAEAAEAGEGEPGADEAPVAEPVAVEAAAVTPRAAKETVAPVPSQPEAAPAATAQDPRVSELTAKMAALEEAIRRSTETSTELETVRTREAELEDRLAHLERELHGAEPTPAAPTAAAPTAAAPTAAAQEAPEPGPVEAVAPAADVVEPPGETTSNGAAAHSEPGGLSEAEVNDLRARLAKAAARKKQGPST